MNKFHSIIAIIILAFLFSCKQDSINENNFINIRLKKDPERINPIIFPNATAREVYQYIHLPLAEYDPVSLLLTPLLIKELPEKILIDTGMHKGGVAFDIEILPEAKWDNGSEITGEDYLFTMKAINLPLTNSGKYREYAQNIKHIDINKVNPKKFRVIFSEDYLQSLEIAVNLELYPRYFYDSLNVLDKYSLEDFRPENEEKLKSDSTLVKFSDIFNGNDFSRNKINGSGPYKFVSWISDQSIILDKKKDYWAKNSEKACLAQGPDRIIFHIIPDELSAIAQLKAGNIDLINEISAESYKELLNDELTKNEFKFYHPALIKQYFININNRDDKLSDVKVRRALAHLIDVDNIISNLENGMAVRTVGPIHPIKKTCNEKLVPVKYDVDSAKNLLKEAGWVDSNNDGVVDKMIKGKRVEMELEILITGQELGKKVALMLKESAEKAGIKINISEKEFKQIRAENLKTRNYQLVPSILSQDINMWDDLKGKWHSENDTPEGSNDVSYHNKLVDALLDKIPTARSDKDRIEIYKKIQEQIYIDQPAIFLYAPEEKIVVSSKWNSYSTPRRPGYLANSFMLIANKKVVK